jgi:hypothetical protein
MQTFWDVLSRRERKELSALPLGIDLFRDRRGEAVPRGR